MKALRRLRCKVSGHNWHMIWKSSTTAYSFLWCRDCGDIGWQE